MAFVVSAPPVVCRPRAEMRYCGAMFEIDWENPAYLCVRASGRLSWLDYDLFVPAFEAELGRRGNYAPLLLDVRGWRGWTPGGFARDLFFNLSNRHSFPRIAVIGDRPWHKWLTLAAKPIFIAPMRYFDGRDERAAVAWVSAD